MSDKPTFVLTGEAVRRLRRRLADAGRDPTIEIRVSGSDCTVRITNTNGTTVQKDADDGDITNG